uniref:C-terminal processing peptidase-3. Serine peptidase. MEROPS family S41A n=1 Tax=Solibacter usitatus (strain Ellin6076) TaxID=234267 RepID=Q023Q8_SOLUE
MLRSTLVLLCTACLLSAQDDFEKQMRSVIGAYAIAAENAADPITSEQAFYAGAIPGLLRKLDPHSIFFDPEQFEQLKRMESSTSKGFGSVVSILPGRVIVLQTISGTPSQKAGLAPGDEILAINGYVIGQLDIEQLPQLLEQSRQRQARLDVRRPGVPGLMHFTLTPEEMQSPSVDRAFFLAAGIGYIRVSSFDEKTGQQIKAAIEKLGGDRLAGLVLDLRNNPGGVLGAAIETCSLFLKPGMKIVTVRGRHVPETTEVVPSIAAPYGFKLAILVNEKSASASEVVSGAMQDHDRATIIGVPSFGKGLVQSVFPLTQNTGLALTTALYYTPSGRSIQKPLDSAKFALGPTTAHPNAQSEFHTDKGRRVTGGGGIQPDFVVNPSPSNRLRAVLDASASFTNFATEYLRAHKVDADFEVTPELLDQFRVFLSDREIRPGLAEWLTERDFVSNRLKTELFNQAIGVEKGDEVEAQRDPVILKALEVIG